MSLGPRKIRHLILHHHHHHHHHQMLHRRNRARIASHHLRCCCVWAATRRGFAAWLASKRPGACSLRGFCRVFIVLCLLSSTLSPTLLCIRTRHKKPCKAARQARALTEGADDVASPAIAAPLEAESGAPTVSPPQTETCDQCTQAVPELLVCLGCHRARYCCVACQKGAW